MPTPKLPEPASILRQLYSAAVARAMPAQNLAAYLPAPPTQGRTVVLGAGKAAATMVHALEALWPAQAILTGLVVTRYGHHPPRPAGQAARVEIMEAAHPVPDAASMVAAQQMLALAQTVGPQDLVLCLISGGGSALLALPAAGLSLAEKQHTVAQLLASGASIAEINCVRKHLSAIKGGRLAQAAGATGARVVTLAISDVPGDDPSVIASGPSVADASTCAQALAVLAHYQIQIPPSVHAALRSGLLETPKPAAFLARAEQFVYHCIASPMDALHAAAEAAASLGLAAYILSDQIEGEATEVGKVHAALARSCAPADAGPYPDSPFYGKLRRPCVLLSGGETSVTMRAAPAPEALLGKEEERAAGTGGRAGEFCLGLAQGLQGAAGIWALAADTDGIDGVSEAAGAFVRPDTLARARALGLDIRQFQARHDSHGYFAQLDDLLVTGPTHTNVNDFRAILLL